MQPSAPPQRSVLLRRYGPLIAILVALVVVAAVVLATRGGNHKTNSSGAKTTDRKSVV